jgi:hypothetical protein
MCEQENTTMCETETDESKTQVVPTVAGSEMLVLQALLQRAAPMLRNPERFADSDRTELAATICQALQTAQEEDLEPGGLLALWE